MDELGPKTFESGSTINSAHFETRCSHFVSVSGHRLVNVRRFLPKTAAPTVYISDSSQFQAGHFFNGFRKQIIVQMSQH